MVDPQLVRPRRSRPRAAAPALSVRADRAQKKLSLPLAVLDLIFLILCFVSLGGSRPWSSIPGIIVGGFAMAAAWLAYSHLEGMPVGRLQLAGIFAWVSGGLMFVCVPRPVPQP